MSGARKDGVRREPSLWEGRRVSLTLLDMCSVSGHAFPPESLEDVTRTLVVHVERLFGEALEFGVDHRGQPLKLTKRARQQRISGGPRANVSEGDQLPLLWNGREKADQYIGISGWITRGAVDGKLELSIQVGAPCRLLNSVGNDLLVALGRDLKLCWGVCSQGNLAGIVAAQKRPVSIPGIPEPAPFKPPPGLPEICHLEQRDVVARPAELGWINFWSDTAADLAGLGEPVNRGPISAIQRVDSGWAIQLTGEPFDSKNKGHMRTLKYAYERFPGVGRPAKSVPLRTRPRP